NKIAAAGLDGARKSKPAAFFEGSLSRLVTVGNFDDDLKRLAEVDWIIEAIVENLDIKRSLLKKVEAIRKPGTIVTTNTSGLPALVVRHTLFQSAALYASAGTDPHARRRPRTDRLRRALLRRATGQGRGAGERYSQLYRQSHWHILRAQRDAAHAGNGPDGRRNRHAHRLRRRLAALGHLPDHRSGGPRHPRTRG